MNKWMNEGRTVGKTERNEGKVQGKQRESSEARSVAKSNRSKYK